MKNLDQIIALENEISGHVKQESGCTVHFKYSEDGTVRAFTYNPKIKEFFLLYSAPVANRTQTEVDSLMTILAYVKSHKNEFNSYTIKWRKVEYPATEVNTSYFYCKNAKEAMDKFYEGKDPDLYYVELLTVNPIA